MYTTQQLYDVFKKKISNQEKADRLDITIEEYDELKKIIYEVIDQEQDALDQVFIEKLDARLNGEVYTPYSNTEYHEDLEKGTMKVTSLVSEEPRSAEEIIKLLRIDTTKWKLSQYWNKQKGSKWEVSALVVKKKDQEVSIEELLSSLKLPEYPKIENVFEYQESSPACGVISLQDLHFGKGDDAEIEEELLKSVNDLMGRALKNNSFDEIVLVLGGDILNMDTFNDTTTSGTPLKSTRTAMEAYVNAFNACCKLISFLKQTCNDLRIIYIPGNHDRLSSFHLLHALSQAFINNHDILFDVEYDERKVHIYGNNMLCFEHGDVSKKTTPLVYATEYPLEWGNSIFRRLYTGHYHIKKTTEVISENEIHGFTTKILPSLCSTDYWHYYNKYIGSKRAAVLEVNDKEKGMIAEYIYTIN